MAAGFLGRIYRLGKNLITWGLGGGSGAPPPPVVRLVGCEVTVSAQARPQSTTTAQGYITITTGATARLQTTTRIRR